MSEDDWTTPLERELRALLVADLRVSGATTLDEMHDAAVASLLSLIGKPQTVAVSRDAFPGGPFRVSVEGPDMLGLVTVAMSGCDTSRLGD